MHFFKERYIIHQHEMLYIPQLHNLAKRKYDSHKIVNFLNMFRMEIIRMQIISIL